MAEETTSETTTTTTTEPAGGKTPDGTDREEAFTHRLAKEREKWEKEHAETFAKAKSHDELIESQKTEAQKAIDAANKKAEDAIKKATAAEREAVLAKAGVKDEDVDLFDGVPADKIADIAAKIAGSSESGKEPPTPRGKERFVTGSGRQDDPDVDMESLVKDLF